MNPNELIKLINDVQKKWGDETVKAMKNKLKEMNVEWEGNLKDSLKASIVDGEVKFSVEDYGKFVDEGVDGLIVKHNSPFSFKGNYIGTAFNIEPWATSKGLSAFAVAYTIQRKGLKPRPFFKSVIEQRIPELGLMIQKAQEDLIAKSISEFTNRP